MSFATFTIPSPILDMLAKGLREMDDSGDAPDYLIWGATRSTPGRVYLETDAGDVLIFVRAPDMERT